MNTLNYDYQYTNSVLPGSGEYALNRILKPMAYARKPGVYRIPNLQVPHIAFIYGEHDWMDVNGGLDVQRICEEKRSRGELSAPEIDVHIIRNAGHLLMLENWEEFNTSMLAAAFGDDYVTKHISFGAPRPLRVRHSDVEHSREKKDSDTAVITQPDVVASLDS